MSVIWALRADNSAMKARRSAAGISPTLFGGANKPTYQTDGTDSVNGHYIDLDGGSNSNRQIVYPARGVFSNQAFSILIRGWWPSFSINQGVYEIASANSYTSNIFRQYLVSANWRATIYNEAEAAAINQSTISSTSVSTSTWHDMGLSWDGTTGSNKIILYIDGVSIGTWTASVAASNPRNAQMTDTIAFGAVDNLFTTRYRLSEAVIWDTAIDFTSNVTLESGAALLNGASRTSPVAVNPWAGQPLYTGGF